jgi:hypothetical protein
MLCRRSSSRALKKQRQREIEDYEYKKALERKKAQDKYEEELRAQEKANRERQDQLERSWQEREAALKEREDELARLRQQAAEFPERLRQENERAAAQASRALICNSATRRSASASVRERFRSRCAFNRLDRDVLHLLFGREYDCHGAGEKPAPGVTARATNRGTFLLRRSA